MKGVRPLNLKISSAEGKASNPLLYGLLYEDVCHSGDGGIYAELIRNRAFQGDTLDQDAPFPRNLQFWHAKGGVELELNNSEPHLSPQLPYHMRVKVPSGTTGPVGFWNEGFWGMDVKANQNYTVSLYLRGSYEGTIVCSFWSEGSQSILGSTQIKVFQPKSQGWRRYEQNFVPFFDAPDGKNSFHLSLDGGSTAGSSLDFHIISVFPETYKGGCLRKDLAKAVHGLNGKFLRFPGGNNMEGPHPPYFWRWNETIGPIINRPGRPGTWGYPNTDGLGLIEMMEWCDQMKLEPILGVWGGMYLDGTLIPESELAPHIEDVMNELEFLMGPASTKFGSQRAALGHPEPWIIKYIEISNEDYVRGPLAIESYINYRFPLFFAAIHAKYPSVIVLSTVSPAQGFTNPPPGVGYDLHEYRSTTDMLRLYHEYDTWSRDRPLLMGEYATILDDYVTQDINRSQNDHVNSSDRTSNFNKTKTEGESAKSADLITTQQLQNPTLRSALAEAVMLLGLERNSDIVIGSCHGALMKSYGDGWDVALLKHTASKVVKHMSYYIAQLFAKNTGSIILNVESNRKAGPLYWSVTGDMNGRFFVKIVNHAGANKTPITVELPAGDGGKLEELGREKRRGKARLQIFTAPEPTSENNLAGETHVLSEMVVEADQHGRFRFDLVGSYVAAVLVI